MVAQLQAAAVWRRRAEESQREPSYRDGSRDALLVAPKTFALFPAHGLQHFVSNVVTVEAVLCGLLVVTIQGEENKNKTKLGIFLKLLLVI